MITAANEQHAYYESNVIWNVEQKIDRQMGKLAYRAFRISGDELEENMDKAYSQFVNTLFHYKWLLYDNQDSRVSDPYDPINAENCCQASN